MARLGSPRHEVTQGFHCRLDNLTRRTNFCISLGKDSLQLRSVPGGLAR